MILSMLIAFLISISTAIASDKPNPAKKLKDYESKAYTHAEIYDSGVASPLGYFLLVRKGNNACAVRFTNFWRDNDEKKPTVFSSGQENVYAEHEWYFQGDGSFDFTKDNVKHGNGKVHDGPSYGIGRAAFKFHLPLQVKCGEVPMFWRYPTRLLFEDNAGLWDKEIEIAPTKWKTIGEVNFKSPILLWTRYSDYERLQYIPLDQLP